MVKVKNMDGKVVNGAPEGRQDPIARIVPVDTTDMGGFQVANSLTSWVLPKDETKLAPLKDAAERLMAGDYPVGFPTETVYGLGADATSSKAVKGIYLAKGRPSDNPLIIHVCDLTMLRSLTFPDDIPPIYAPLIQRFWPGPLTILLPNPKNSHLAPEVTAGLKTFGVRMPDSPLALSLIQLAGVPLAAPSANRSTKPSPTTAQHVLYDLPNKIEIILDGGSCQVGVESTVVDGLCDPPVVLRPGGVSLDSIRQCEGWERVQVGYKDSSEIGKEAPRAPGMKYKHYSPTASVALYDCSPHAPGRENGTVTPAMGSRNGAIIWEDICPVVTAVLKQVMDHVAQGSTPILPTFGVVTTKHWEMWAGLNHSRTVVDGVSMSIQEEKKVQGEDDFFMTEGELWCEMATGKQQMGKVYNVPLGKDTKAIAHGLFSALRALDLYKTDIIFVEGIDDDEDIAAAVMNRLRKAASTIHPI